MNQIKLEAYAKINLALDVLRRREDGYHEVRMIMQTIALHDDLEFQKTAESGIHIQTNCSDLPVNEDNLIYKAASLLMKEFNVTEGVQITLEKRIPVAAGLAGGSTDAAATLKGINQLFELELSQEELMEHGAKIGADVPYCVLGGTALAEGIGEILTPLPPMTSCPILIAKPAEGVSTKYVYQHLKLDNQTVHPDVDEMIASIQNGELQAVAQELGNVLETVTVPKLPVIAEIKECMMRAGALNTLMSGSGPTVFGLFSDKETAQRAYEEMKRFAGADQVILTSLY